MKGLFQCPPRAAPWVFMDANLSPCKGKSLQYQAINKAFALTQGALLIAIIPRALPWAKSFCPFRACNFYDTSCKINGKVSFLYCAEYQTFIRISY